MAAFFLLPETKQKEKKKTEFISENVFCGCLWLYHWSIYFGCEKEMEKKVITAA